MTTLTNRAWATPGVFSEDMYAHDSIQLLKNSGIDFQVNKVSWQERVYCLLFAFLSVVVVRLVIAAAVLLSLGLEVSLGGIPRPDSVPRYSSVRKVDVKLCGVFFTYAGVGVFASNEMDTITGTCTESYTQPARDRDRDRQKQRQRRRLREREREKENALIRVHSPPFLSRGRSPPTLKGSPT